MKKKEKNALPLADNDPWHTRARAGVEVKMPVAELHACRDHELSRSRRRRPRKVLQAATQDQKTQERPSRRDEKMGVPRVTNAGAALYKQMTSRIGAKIFGVIPRRLASKDEYVVKVFRQPPHKPLEEWWSRSRLGYDAIAARLRYQGVLRDEQSDFNDYMTAKRRERGKVKPKKGEGKQAKKKRRK